MHAVDAVAIADLVEARMDESLAKGDCDQGR